MNYSTTIEAGIIEELTEMRDKNRARADTFRTAIAGNTSIGGEIQWAGNAIIAEFIYSETLVVLGKVRRGECDLAAALKDRLEDLEHGLLENRWRASSTSPLHNGVEACRAEAASTTYRAFQCWYAGRSWSGKFQGNPRSILADDLTRG